MPYGLQARDKERKELLSESKERLDYIKLDLCNRGVKLITGDYIMKQFVGPA